MTGLYPNLCYNEVCYKGTALYSFTNTGHYQLRIAGLLCFARGVPMNQGSKILYQM